jgi:ferritin
MLISEKVAEKINQQVGNEFAASIQYYALASYFDSMALPVLKGYFMKQAEEEKIHALKFVEYLNDAGAGVKIPSIPQPQCTLSSVQAAIELSLMQEIAVTNQIKAIYEVASQEKDYLTEQFLQWFLEEQLEEVSSMEDLLIIVKRAGDESNLFRVEDYVARRGHPEDKAR